jgi:hypothetical protein
MHPGSSRLARDPLQDSFEPTRLLRQVSLYAHHPAAVIIQVSEHFCRFYCWQQRGITT